MASAKLISGAVERVQAQVPAFTNLKLVFGLELTAGGLTSPAKSEHYRVQLPGPDVSEGEADDVRLRLSVPKAMFEILAKEGDLADWKDAFYYGHLKVGGDERVKRLLAKALKAS